MLCYFECMLGHYVTNARPGFTSGTGNVHGFSVDLNTCGIHMTEASFREVVTLGGGQSHID